MTNERATGGTLTIDTPTLVEHQFTANGSFALMAVGTLNVSYLVIAGGGGGGARRAGGGGGGGEAVPGTTSVISTQAAVIGGGGAGGIGSAEGTRNGSPGQNSSFAGTTASGGGYGAGGGNSPGPDPGGNGGSGGGGGATDTVVTSLGGVGEDGGDGGTGNGNTNGLLGGGGGGGGASGTNGVNASVSTGGNGGIGYLWLNGSRYGGGGGGGAGNGGGTGTPGTGGTGGGGNGVASGTGVSGAVNTGGGGGGTSSAANSAGAGGSGTVFVRYNPAADWTPAPPNRKITAQLLDYDGTPVSGTPLVNAFGVSFYDEENGPGRGQVSLSLSEAGSADLLPGRYINCLVEGTVRFTFKIEGKPQYNVIERGEEHDQIVSVSGRGWACIMDDAITYPEYDLKFMIGTTWRLFSFASPSYPGAGAWPAATAYQEYLDGVTTMDCYGHAQIAPDGIWYPAPIGFPWTTNSFNLVGGVPTANYADTFWIRPDSSVMPTFNDPGYYFFRGEFTLSAGAPVTFTVTGDNFFTLFIEGVPILGEEILNGDAWIWQGWKEQTIWLPAGTFTVAAAVYNVSYADLGDGSAIFWPPCPAESFAGGATFGSPGGLIFAAYVEGDAFFTPPGYVYTSDSSWDSWYELDTWPGWTPGEIIQKLIDEATARGAMTIYNSNTFTAPNDSNSDAWRPAIVSVTRPDLPTFAVEVWSTLMNALEELDAQGWINWHVRPGTWILDVMRGRAPASPTSLATFAAGTNLVAFERSATAPYANVLMVQWEGGYVVVEDAAAITAYGTRVEDGYSTDAPSEEEAILQGENELLRRAQSQYPAIVAVVEPTSVADCPYEAFETGDYVTVPAFGGGTEVVRVLSIQCTQDDDPQSGTFGYAIWTLELNNKLDVPERKTTRLLQQLGGRNQVVRGSVQS